MHGLHWPDAVIFYVVAALAVGFPLVVGLAWIFDVKAAGILQPVLVRSSRSRLELLLVWIAALAAAGGCSTVAFLRRSPGLTSARPWLRGPRTRSSVGTHIRAKAC